MKENDLVKFKDNGKYGVIMFPSKQKSFGFITFSTLNLVVTEDGTYKMCRDDDLELIEMQEEE